MRKQKTIDLGPAQWTREDANQALRDGWDVFVQDDGTFKIQRVDDTVGVAAELGIPKLNNEFSSDWEALDYVITKAKNEGLHRQDGQRAATTVLTRKAIKFVASKLRDMSDIDLLAYLNRYY